MNEQMINIAASPFLFAKVDDSTVTMCIVGAVVLVVVVGVAAFFGNRIAKKMRFESHGSLFSNLCKAHNLPRKERNLLKHIGQEIKVPQLSLLIADPQWLDRAIITKSLAPKLKSMKKLRARFFNLPEKAKSK